VEKNRRSVQYSEEALSQLGRISDYIFVKSGAGASEKVCDEILNDVKRLEDTPFAGRAHPDEFLAARGYRILFTGKHVVEYLIFETIIWVAGVHPQKADWLRVD
jgi:plasmid stabilization system protein ParE